MKWTLVLKGFVMGIAEAIPGVSGGTIAFITGIYLELLETIKSITPGNLKLILTDRRGFWKAINGNFLILLILGMFFGLLFGVVVIAHLLENHQSLLWALFFGLILGSAVYMGRSVKWKVDTISLAILGAIITFLVTTLIPATGSTNWLYLIISGALAVSALMLPGLSGSFIILLLGLYSTIISGLKNIISFQDLSALPTIALFGFGALIGLFTFARLLSYLFRNYENRTMGIMIGVLIGSLNKLWPWKKITMVYSKIDETTQVVEMIRLSDPENFKIVKEVNLLPWEFSSFENPQILYVLLCFVLGLALVFGLSKLEHNQSA